MSPRAPYLPHIYATAAQPDTDLARETFSTLAFSAENPLDAGLVPYSGMSVPFESSLNSNGEKMAIVRSDNRVTNHIYHR